MKIVDVSRVVLIWGSIVESAVTTIRGPTPRSPTPPKNSLVDIFLRML